jgi:hypothetical protein
MIQIPTFEMSPYQLEGSNLSVQTIATYALNHGWQKISHPNPGFWVFQEPASPQYEEPAHLVIPNQDGSKDMPLRLSDAINLLAAVEQRSATAILADLETINARKC